MGDLGTRKSVALNGLKISVKEKKSDFFPLARPDIMQTSLTRAAPFLLFSVRRLL